MVNVRHQLVPTCIVLGLTTLLMILNTSCFGDEPEGCEADIETVTLHVAHPEDYFFQMTDSMQAIYSTDSIITIAVRGNADVSALAPVFTLSPGASVTPASGSTQDFSQGPVVYSVTSQDGKWHRRYRVSIVPTVITVTDTLRFDFEQYELEPVGQRFYMWPMLLDNGSTIKYWATANDGFRISMGSAKAMDYPTTPLDNAYDGAGVCLTTRSTGPFGAMANKRLAAGNMYLGTFDIKIAMSDHLHATRFGIPFADRPNTFKGYYTYQPGPTVQDFYGNPIAGRTDSADVYAVFYRNHDAQGNEVCLYGDDVLSSPYIVAVADIGYVKPTAEWTPWEVKFEYRADVTASPSCSRRALAAATSSEPSAAACVWTR